MKDRPILVFVIGISALLLVVSLSAVAGGTLYRFISSNEFPTAFAAADDIDRDSGILVAGVGSGSPADDAGVVRGDIIQELNGESIPSLNDLQDFVKGLDEAQEIEFTVIHGDEIKELSAEFATDYPYLGIKSCNCEFAFPEVFSKLQTGVTEGALVLDVTEDSPADTAGLKIGDMITHVDGEEIGEENDLAEIVGSHEPGEIITITIQRSGEDPQDLEVELGEHPDDADKAYLGIRYDQFVHPMSGGNVLPFGRNMPPFRQMPFDDQTPFEFPKGLENGALIVDVTPDSPAEGANFQPGDVITGLNDESIENPKDLITEIGKFEPGDKISLTLYSTEDKKEETVEIELGEHPEKSGVAFLGVKVAGLLTSTRFNQGQLPFDLDENLFKKGFPEDFHFDLPFDLPFKDLMDKVKPGENA